MMRQSRIYIGMSILLVQRTYNIGHLCISSLSQELIRSALQSWLEETKNKAPVRAHRRQAATGSEAFAALAALASSALVSMALTRDLA